MPAIATRGGELFLSYGVVGGYMQVRIRNLFTTITKHRTTAPRPCADIA